MKTEGLKVARRQTTLLNLRFKRHLQSLRQVPQIHHSFRRHQRLLFLHPVASIFFTSILYTVETGHVYSSSVNHFRRQQVSDPKSMQFRELRLAKLT